MKRLLARPVFVVVICAAAGGEPGRRRRRRPGRREPRARGVSASRRIAGRRSRRCPTAFSAWFDDHFGFRSRLVRWYGESRLFVLGVSPSAAVVKGEHGWFFYGDDKSVEDYANVEPMTDAALANWRAAIVARARLAARAAHRLRLHHRAGQARDLRRRRCRRRMVRVGELSRADQLFTALQDTGLAVDVRGAEFDAKSRERVYQQTDTHWNDRGALAAYQQIIAAVRARVPATPPAWTRDDFSAGRPHHRRARSGRHDGADARAARGRHDAGAEAAATRARASNRPARSRPTKTGGSSPRSTIRRCRAR